MDSAFLGNASSSSDQPPQDHTTTFLVGFGVLLIFVIIGLMASAFLCITLKKDQYLWQLGAETQLQDKRRSIEGGASKDKVEPDENEVISI